MRLMPKLVESALASTMERLKDRLWVGFGDAEEGTGGAFRVAVALFPVLEGDCRVMSPVIPAIARGGDSWQVPFIATA